MKILDISIAFLNLGTGEVVILLLVILLLFGATGRRIRIENASNERGWPLVDRQLLFTCFSSIVVVEILRTSKAA